MKSPGLWIAIVCLMATAGPSTVQPPPLAQQRPEPDLCAVPPGAQPLLPGKILPGMGTTNMPVTTSSAEARKFFNQGVSQVHSFWMVEAERSFLQAAALDPDMAMAYWGISVSAAGDYRPAFQLLRDPYDGGRGPASASSSPDAVQRTSNGAAIDGRTRAREAIARATALGAKVTPRERLYIAAEAARRASGDAAHITGLRALVAAYPDDLEARSILGLALLDGYDSVTKVPRTNTVEGVTLLHSVIEKDDNHFGAHHYLIHGWEGSTTPERAWPSCQRYPQMVTNIPHALHMPGHIYAQSGRIDDAVTSFSVAAANELTWVERDVLYPVGHHGHNVQFLVHSLNLAGRYRDSIARVQHMMEFKETPRERAGNIQRTPYRQGYFGLVRTLVRFERWDLALDGKTLPVYEKPEQQAWRAWAVGLGHASQGQIEEARKAHESMKGYLASVTASKRPLAIAEVELDAAITARAGDTVKGYGLYRTAAAMEAALIYTEPPSYPRPVVEGLGSTAAALGDHAVAEQAFREALSREPASGRAQFGISAGLRAQRQDAAAREMAALALKAWDKADADLPQLASRTSTSGGQR